MSNLHDTKNAINHLKQHQMYPATKADLVKECNELSDFSEADKKWFEQNLPEGTYNAPEEVIMALGLDQQMHQSMAI